MQKVQKLQRLFENKYVEWATLVVALFIFCAVYMGSSFWHPSTTVLGNPNDHTSGIIYANFTHLHTPFPGYSLLSDYPFGENFRIPISATTQVPSLIHWTLAKGTNIVTSWNLMVLLGYLCNAIIAYMFIKWLTKSKLPALFGAFALSFTPYHAFSSTGQIAGMFGGLFIVALWLFFCMWQKPTLKYAALLGLLCGFSFYIDGYFILLSIVLFGSLWVSVISFSLLMVRRLSRELKLRIYRLVQASLISLICLLPLAWVNSAYSKQISDILGNARSAILVESQTYSAKLSQFISPSSVLYVGISVLLLAGLYTVISSKSMFIARKQQQFAANDKSFVGWTLLTLAVFSIWFSLQPIFYVGTIKLFNPSYLVISLTAVWRVFGRLYLLASIGIVTMAALSLQQILDRFGKYRVVLCIVIMLVTIVDLAVPSLHFNKTSFNYKNTPKIYTWLRANKETEKIKAIAEYPIEGYGYQAEYFTYQQVSAVPVLNANIPNSPHQKLKQSVLGINDPQTVPVLRALGIDMVNIRNIFPENGEQILIRKTARENSNLHLLFSDSDHVKGIDSYKILPGTRARYALVIEPSPLLVTKLQKDGTANYVHSGDITMSLELLPGTPPEKVKTISFNILADSQRDVTIVQNGRRLWDGKVNTSRQSIQLSVDPIQRITFYVQHNTKQSQLTISQMQVSD